MIGRRRGDQGPRTPEQREAERLAREERRARAEGRPSGEVPRPIPRRRVDPPAAAAPQDPAAAAQEPGATGAPWAADPAAADAPWAADPAPAPDPAPHPAAADVAPAIPEPRAAVPDPPAPGTPWWAQPQAAPAPAPEQTPAPPEDSAGWFDTALPQVTPTAAPQDAPARTAPRRRPAQDPPVPEAHADAVPGPPAADPTPAAAPDPPVPDAPTPHRADEPIAPRADASIAPRAAAPIFDPPAASVPGPPAAPAPEAADGDDHGHDPDDESGEYDVEPGEALPPGSPVGRPTGRRGRRTPPKSAIGRPLVAHPDDEDGDHEPVAPLTTPKRRVVPAAAVGGAAAPRRRRFRLRVILGLAAIVVPLVVVATLAILTFQPFAGDGRGEDEVRVTIPQGSSVGEIGRLLAKAGVVDSGTFFSVRARLDGNGGSLRSGTVTLRRGMSYATALEVLGKPPAATAPTIDVVMPEGPSRREYASVAKKAGVTGSYLRSSARAPSSFDPGDYGRPRSEKSLEGFLYPATYRLPRATPSARRLVADQLKTFREEAPSLTSAAAKRRKLSRYDVLIIASMIEREVRVASERPLVAAVIYNRLRLGMPLQIDATTRYATNNWTRPIRQSELDSSSPYDTRNRTGLPPTPIGNPGAASMRAAANPARSSFLYYVVRPGGKGRHNFSSNGAEFNRDKAAYDKALAEAGGDPSGVEK